MRAMLFVVGGLLLGLLLVCGAMLLAEHNSRKGMNPEQRQAAKDSYRAAMRGDRAAIREAELRLARSSHKTGSETE